MPIDHSKLKKTRTRSGRGGWSPREGENRIRVLPPRSRFLTEPEEMDNFAIPYKIHFFKSEGRASEVSRCLKDAGLGRCPACDAWWAYKKAEDPGLKEMAKAVSPSDQYLFNIIDLNNVQAGIQQWAANWTCWDKIMEIGANPEWGDVISITEGINFQITKTPGTKTRTGFNQYSVMPEPTRSEIKSTLETLGQWEDQLDLLEGQISDAKNEAEMQGLLLEIGFPETHSARTLATPAATPTAPAVPSPPASTVPAPGTPPAAATAPAPAAQAPIAPAAQTAAAPPIPQAGAPQPGAKDLPVCFGNYDPSKYPCPTCPVQADCQTKYLGIAE